LLSEPHFYLISKMQPSCRDIIAHLPMTASGQLKQHHLFTKQLDAAGKPLWNEGGNAGPRFDGLKHLLPSGNCTMLYIGGNVEGADGNIIHSQHGCRVYILEPVPQFFKKLSTKFARVPGISTHNFGVGNATTLMRLEGGLRGQGTSYQSATKLSDSNSQLGQLPRQEGMTMRILSVEDTLRELSLAGKFIDLLHVNCEGCEYELLLSLVEQPHRLTADGTVRSGTSFADQFGTIQFGTHNYPADGVKTIVPQYCAIRHALARTHWMQWGTPFVWERWLHRRVHAVPQLLQTPRTAPSTNMSPTLLDK
jgi:FkbM family methyltransferase